MSDLIIGAILMAGFLLLVEYTRKNQITVKWWQWVLTVLEFAYIAFVLVMIKDFIYEGAAKAALVMGLIFGFFAIIGGILLARFIFSKK